MPVEESAAAAEGDAALTPAVKELSREELEDAARTARVVKTMECFINEDSGLPAISVDEVRWRT